MPESPVEILALFPLDHVLLPGVPLPLHVFEPRYRQLVADLRSTGPGHGSFGVVLGQAPVRPQEVAIGSPHETSVTARRHAGVEVADVGTVAAIMENEPYPDGRCDLLTVGTRRFRILDLDSTSRPYLQAHVVYLADEPGADANRALAAARRLLAGYQGQLGQLVNQAAAERLSDDAVRASYEIAGRIQLSTDDRQMLLAADTAANRLWAVRGLLRREMGLLSATRSVPVPPQLLYLPSGKN